MIGQVIGNAFLVDDPCHRLPLIAFELRSALGSVLACGVEGCSKLGLAVEASQKVHAEGVFRHFAAAIVPCHHNNGGLFSASEVEKSDDYLLSAVSPALHARKVPLLPCVADGSPSSGCARLLIWRKDCSSVLAQTKGRDVAYFSVPLAVEAAVSGSEESSYGPVLRVLDECEPDSVRAMAPMPPKLTLVDVPVRISGGVIAILADAEPRGSLTEGAAAFSLAEHPPASSVRQVRAGAVAVPLQNDIAEAADGADSADGDEAFDAEHLTDADAANPFTPSTHFRAALSRSVTPSFSLPATQQRIGGTGPEAAASFVEVSSGAAMSAAASSAAAMSAADAALAAEVAAAQARFPIPGLSSILKIGMKVLMPPVFDPVLAKTKNHMEHTLSQTLGKDSNSATPKDTAAMLEPDLRRNLTALLVDTVTSAVTQPTSTRLTDTLAPPTIASAVGAAQASLVDSLTDSLQQLLSLKLGRSLPTALFRSLRAALVPALTKSLTHTLVPTLSRALKPHAVRHAGATGGPAASAAEMGATGARIAPWEPTAAADVGVAIDHALATCLRQAAEASVAGLPPGTPVVDPASASASSAGAAGSPVVSDPFECWAALSRTAEYGDLYVAHYAASYYAAHAAAYARSAVAAVDAEQFRDNVP